MPTPQHSSARVVIVGLTAVTATCSPEPMPESTIALTPTASVSTDAFGSHVALISADVACAPDSYQFRVKCYGRGGEVVGAWGREGEGPGEFQDLMQVRRWPNQRVAVFGLGGRMSVFEPTGTFVSEFRIPGTIMVNGIDSTTVFGLEPRLGGGGLWLVELDVESGKVVWERAGYADIGAEETACGRKRSGVPTPEDGWVFAACGHQLVFMEHRDDPVVTVFDAPNYVEEFPNQRDVLIMRSTLESPALQGSFNVPPPSQREQYIADYRARPKEWFIGSQAMEFDSRDRFWIGTRRDHSDYSYIDVWTGTEYTGSARIRDRLVAFDILGSTLVTVVRRPPDRNGFSMEAVDWYDIGDVRFGSPNPAPPNTGSPESPPTVRPG